MKLGIGTYTFMWSIGFPGAEPPMPMNAFDLLRKARDLGVWVVQYGPNLSLTNLTADELSSFIDLAQRWGISIEIGTQGLETQNLREQLLLAKRAGSRLLRTTTDGADGVTVPVDEMRELILAVVPDLQEQEVFLAIENGRVAAATLAELVSSARSTYVGITLDTVNSLAIPEGTHHVVKTLSPHVRSLHIKDFAVDRLWHRMGFSVEGRPAGAGQLDVPELLHSLVQFNPEANAILELWPPEQATLEDTIRLENAWVEESISYLRRYIEE
jgi:3-oxoisoapionate decarboxylase